MSTGVDEVRRAAWARLEVAIAALGLAPHSVDVKAMPAPVRRYFEHAISPGTPAAPAARLEMRGRIRIGRWLPFRAEQLLAPRLGTVWSARVAAVIAGSDRYAAGVGGMDWRLLRVFRLVHAAGPDVTRSAAERAAGESIWVPTAVLPDTGTSWAADDDHHLRATVDVDDRHQATLHHVIDDCGALRASWFERWGDPDRTGTWARHPFGIEVAGERTFAGVTIPSRGRAGWHFGTDGWDDGVFFEFDIGGYELRTPT